MRQSFNYHGSDITMKQHNQQTPELRYGSDQGLDERIPFNVVLSFLQKERDTHISVKKKISIRQRMLAQNKQGSAYYFHDSTANAEHDPWHAEQTNSREGPLQAGSGWLLMETRC